MELFYSNDCDGRICRMDQEESTHCVKVLRHHPGDMINVIDGLGTMYVCRLLNSSEAQVVEAHPFWGGHPYRLTMAVCPTKNNDRYEWFAEKAAEFGVDVIVPTIGQHSERKVFKTDRLRRILVSAAKQSLKAAVPQVSEALPLKQFISGFSPEDGVIKMICCCYEGASPRVSVAEALGASPSESPRIVVLIGPEGDFSAEELELAVARGFRPVHLGESRLRTETAGVAAVAAVYFSLGRI